MKLKEAIIKLGAASSVATAKHLSDTLNIDWDDGASVIFKVISEDHARIPGNIGAVNDDEKIAISKWLCKYKGGKEGCASLRVSNLPGTVADPVIEKIIGSRIGILSADDLNKITYAHRLGMSAENILGLILEEYLADNLKAYGWHCAWGETVKSVDFVHVDGRLLQIKNRSNSENSSSGAIRKGTQIEKWFRVKADRIEYMWDSLNEICGTVHLSEDKFVEFVQNTLKANPDCLAVEDGNPWACKP